MSGMDEAWMTVFRIKTRAIRIKTGDISFTSLNSHRSTVQSWVYATNANCIGLLLLLTPN